MIFLKSWRRGMLLLVMLELVLNSVWWCLWRQFEVPSTTDVTQWYISSSPRHSPTLTNFTLLNNTCLPFIFNQWRQFWVKSRAINIKNFAIVLPFRIPRSSKVSSKCTKSDPSILWLINHFGSFENIERWMSRQLLLKRFVIKLLPWVQLQTFISSIYSLHSAILLPFVINQVQLIKIENLTFRYTCYYSWRQDFVTVKILSSASVDEMENGLWNT